MKRFAALVVFACSLVQGASPLRDWTFLLYLAGDEPEFQGFNDGFLKRLEELPTLRGDSTVRLVVQYDRPGDDPNYRYLLKYQPSPTQHPGPDTPPLSEAEIRKIIPSFRYHERDSGNPVTLKHFISWGVRAFPARHYALILSGHSYGIYGLMQDFFVAGKDLEPSTIMKNYEVRRAIEEVYREQAQFIPEGKFDLLLTDTCLAGQLDVLMEYKDLFRYIAASSMEMPDSGIPYKAILEPFLAAVGHGTLPPHEALERYFLKDFPKIYAKSYARGGSRAVAGRQIDPVEAFTIRASELTPLADALGELVHSFPSEIYDDWQEGSLDDLADAVDDIGNIDLVELRTRLAPYLLKKYSQKKEAKWLQTLSKLESFDEQLGYRAPDITMEPTLVSDAKAVGAWIHFQVDETTLREIAGCFGLTVFATLNDHPGNQDLLPHFFEGSLESPLPYANFDCNAIGHGQLGPKPKEQPWKMGIPTPLDKVLDRKVRFSHGIRAFLTDFPSKKNPHETHARWLSIWIPRGENPVLKRSLILRLPATSHVRIDYLNGEPEKYLTAIATDGTLRIRAEKLHFAPYQVVTDPKWLSKKGKPGLYISEAHSSGASGHRGLGLFFQDELPRFREYRWGRLPIESVEKAPYSLTLEDYFQGLAQSGKTEFHALEGKAFYRAHRISSTGWPDFLFSAGK